MLELRALLAQPLARLLCALAGAALLVIVVWQAGAREVFLGLGRSAWCLPELVALEAAVLACSTSALRSLYGSEAARNSARTWLKAATLGYVVSVVAPLGRAAAEGARAVILRQGVGGPRAAVAAVEMQGAALLANFIILLAIALGAALPLFGPGWLTGMMLGAGLIAGALGASILIVRHRGRPGRILAAFSKRGRSFGSTFDAEAGATATGLGWALAWESGARALQCVQLGVALGALGHSLSPRMTLAARGVAMLGAAVGDLLPAQLGATEAALTTAATSLGLTAATASAVALLVHIAQLALAVGCGATGLALSGGRSSAVPAEVHR
jgi:hypothetical protein